MSESNLWSRFRDAAKEFAFLQRVENMVGEGVPDAHLTSRINGVAAWVELKFCPAIPKREATQVFGSHGLRPEQIAWIYCRAIVGARVWILAQVDKHVFLIHGRFAREFNSMSFAQLTEAASWSGHGRVNWGVCVGEIFEG